MKLQLLLLLLGWLGGARAAFTVDPATSSFIGADGRRHLFHGVNVVEKTHQFIPVSCSVRLKTRVGARTTCAKSGCQCVAVALQTGTWLHERVDVRVVVWQGRMVARAR